MREDPRNYLTDHERDDQGEGNGDPVRVLRVVAMRVVVHRSILTGRSADFPLSNEDSSKSGMIEFHLDARAGVPTYLQLVQQVRQAVRLGILGPGDQLPTVKEVVGSLAINPNTVLKAYRELDREGLTEGRRGQGTFVRSEERRVGKEWTW